MYNCIEYLGMNSFSKNIIAASTEPIILSILCEGDSYGYEIIKRIKEITDDKLVWKEGSLYPVLKKLESEKLIKSYFKEYNGRKRKYYSINNVGRQKLVSLKDQWEFFTNTFDKLWKPINL